MPDPSAPLAATTVEPTQTANGMLRCPVDKHFLEGVAGDLTMHHCPVCKGYFRMVMALVLCPPPAPRRHLLTSAADPETPTDTGV